MTGANYTTGYKVENGKLKSASLGSGLECGVYLKNQYVRRFLTW